jgi:hypothetical protein
MLTWCVFLGAPLPSGNTYFNANYTLRPFNGVQNEVLVNAERSFEFDYPPNVNMTTTYDGVNVTKDNELWEGELRSQNVDLAFSGAKCDIERQCECDQKRPQKALKTGKTLGLT